ncbi:L-threonylcarbamoyladenylate synthase [Saliniradius amylolyticus]|uniref:Threonylcarbamoyl-AMP synthase n=1 Tax=Saliniradius amylolyticus TaxID=2183582 RepID=A0A2S2DYQ7_9ALTE|nr:Sua5/YciO/YrdC/YwlC family protein [Saliniradius amylolyticus]AWL10541.1 L-threonylcarbamoyladenylate synthase [Saliniradius amylolyticus]
MNTTSTESLTPLQQAYAEGQLIAYPTEAVFGLGCDPEQQAAVERLLQIKQRPVSKGLILVGATFSQLFPYINDAAIPMDRRAEIVSSWPGPYTWLLPKSAKAPDWITGGSELIAVRVSAHPIVQSLCHELDKPIVSTSANPSGHEPARSAAEVKAYFDEQVYLVDGEVGGNAAPTQIRNGMTGQVIRSS